MRNNSSDSVYNSFVKNETLKTRRYYYHRHRNDVTANMTYFRDAALAVHFLDGGGGGGGGARVDTRRRLGAATGRELSRARPTVFKATAISLPPVPPPPPYPLPSLSGCPVPYLPSPARYHPLDAAAAAATHRPYLFVHGTFTIYFFSRSPLGNDRLQLSRYN